MPEISNRTQKMGTENAFVVLKEVNELTRQGKEILSFCIGQPDFDTPQNIQEAAVKAIKEGKHGYTPSAGIAELREIIAQKQSEAKGYEIDPNDIVVANGAKPFIAYSILSTTDFGVGDEVIYPNPGFPIYESQTIAQGAKPVPLDLLESKEFVFDLNVLQEKITDKTKLLILNSPQNPTGGILKQSDLKAVADLAIDHDFFVYSDEIYSKLVYDGKFESIASVPEMEERTIVVDGLSKTYAMTGWRLGYMINKKLAPHVARWITNIESCPNHISQWAAVEALSGSQEEPKKMFNIFKERRDLIVNGLNTIPGFKCISPGGAFYAYPNVTEACKMVGAKDSEEFRKKLLNEVGVAVLSDIHFGQRIPEEGEHIRLSYATSNENIKNGVQKIKEYMEKNS